MKVLSSGVACVAVVLGGYRGASSFSPSLPTTQSSASASALKRSSAISWFGESRTIKAASSYRRNSLEKLANYATNNSSPGADNQEVADLIGTVALVVPSSASDSDVSKFGSKSPMSPPTYVEAAQQLARKIRHFSDGRIVAKVVTAGENDADNILLTSDALFALGLTSPGDIQYLSRTFRKRREMQQQSGASNMCQFAVDCGSNNYAPLVGPYDEANPSLTSDIAPWSDAASGKRLATQMAELLNKQSTDEFALAVMLFFNRFSGHKVPWVEHSIDVTWEKGAAQNAKELYSMISKCGPCITKCLADENCAACINALDEIDTRDQVSSYRTVVSYESELLRDFSLCILQKNNIFECDAKIPTVPEVQPMATWRGEEVTTDVARGIMIGHLEGVGEASLEVCMI